MHATATASHGSQHNNLFRAGASAEPLCCCEYVNIEGERSHILAVCCDCEAVDDTCDRWIKRLAIPESNYIRIGATVADRSRIPWFGGARPCSWELLISITSIPLLMLLSTLNVAALCVSLLCLPVILILSRTTLRHQPQTQFYYLWILSSFFTLLVAFEVIVAPMPTVSVNDHLAVAILLSLALVCWYRVRTNRGFCRLQKRAPVSVPLKDGEWFCEPCASLRPWRAFHCSVCGRCVRLRDHHCVWLDCCVGGANQRPFVAGLLCVTLALLLAAQLTVTSVCRCRSLLECLSLLPASCRPPAASDAAALFGALYALALAAACAALLAHQCHLVSSGQTGCERRRRRPAVAGSLLQNWCRFVAGRRPCERDECEPGRAVVDA